MYHLNFEPPLKTKPWEIPLTKRQKKARRILASGRKLILLQYDAADDSTFRYRGYNVYQHLRNGKKYGAVYFFRNEQEFWLDLMPNAALFVMIRTRWCYQNANFVNRVKQMGVPVAFDVDDIVFDLDEVETLMSTLNVDMREEPLNDAWFSYVSRVHQCGKMADAYISTNPHLCRRLVECYGDKPYGVIPNTLNEEQLRASDLLAAQKRKIRNRQGFAIGYFSGSPSHVNDFRTIVPELLSFLRNHPDAVLNVAGYMEFPAEMQPLLASGQIRQLPFVDFVTLQKLMAEVDVNIVPLVNNSFTNCKSELKFFEGAVVLTPTVATPIYTYAHAIRNGETGFLCEQGEWEATLEKLYNDPKEASRIAENAAKYCRAHYIGEEAVRVMEECYDALLEQLK